MRLNPHKISENRLIFFQGPEGPKIIDPNELMQDPKDQPDKPKAAEPKGLSEKNRNRMKEGTASIDDIIWERKQEKAKAEAKIFEAKKLNPDLIDENDQRALLEELNKAETDKEIEAAVNKIENIADIKERENAAGKLDEKELGFEHKDIKEYRGKIHDLLSDKDSIKYIGTKQASLGTSEGPFEKWCMEKLRKSPSLKTAKELLHDLENHKDGIKPRREFFEDSIEPMLKKAGIKIDDCKYLKEEGLSERKGFILEAKKTEQLIENTNDEFWSPKAKKEAMQKVLKCESPIEVKETTAEIKKIQEIEDEGFTRMGRSITIAGVTLKEMSSNSRQKYLEGLKDEGDIKKRMAYITGSGKYENGIIEAVKNEASLAGKETTPSIAKDFGIREGLSGIYKDDQESLKSALEGFKTLDFMQKIEALKRHSRIAEKNDKETVKKSQEQLNDSLKAIEKAREKKTLSDKDAKKFRDWASDTKDYTDSNGKIDLKAQKKRHDAMTSSEAVYIKEHRNIKAYELLREKKFIPLHEKVKKDNPNIPLAELKKWQADYDKGSFIERKEVYMKLKEHAAELEEKRKEKERMEAEAGITDKEKREAAEMPTDRNDLIVKVTEWKMERTPESIGKAFKALNLYIHNLYEKNEEPDNTIVGLMAEIAELKLQFSIKPPTDESREQKVEATTKKVVKDQFEKEMKQSAVIQTNIEQTDKNEDLNRDAGTDVEERAEAENIKQAHGDQERIGIIEDFYKGQREESGSSDHSHVIKTEGKKTGEDITTVSIGETMTSEEIQQQESAIRGHRSRITKDKGFDHAELKDESGKVLDSSEAAAKHEQETENLDSKIAEAAAAVMQQENKVDKPKANFSSATDELAARRAAIRLREEAQAEILKKAA